MEQENITDMRYSVKNDDSDTIEIDLVQMAKIVFSKILYIIVSGIIVAGLIFLISVFVIHPKYQSVTQLYIINRQNDGVTTYSDIQSSTQLVKDYKVLVTSSPVLEKVISSLKLDMTIKELQECIEISIETDSRVLEITVTTKDPYLSKNIADSIADVSAEQITKVMQIEGVNVIQYGRISEEPSSPNVKLNTLVGLAAGMLASAAFFIIKFMTDDTIKSSEDIEKYLGVSTLALIPYAAEEDDNDMSKKKKSKKR